jgi:feruloyl esterase
VHLGFYAAWNSVAQAIKDQRDAASTEYPDYNLVISGISLGGAIANLAFASLAPIEQYHVTGVYNFGQPRVGNAAYANYIDDLAGASDMEAGIFHRVTHANDGVPRVPPKWLGFHHSRTEYWVSQMNGTESTTYQCFGQEPEDCNDAQGGLGVNAAHTSYPGFEEVCPQH